MTNSSEQQSRASGPSSPPSLARSAGLYARAEAVIPERLRDWVYNRVAANRYRWFGKAEACALLTPEQRRRLISR